MSYDMGGGAGGGNQKSKKYKPRSFGERQGANSGYPVRPGQPGKYSHDPTISTGVIERQISPKLQLGQAPPHGVGEDVQKQEGTVGGSGGTDTVGVPIPPSGIDISNLLSKAVHVPDFTTIISKCTGSLYTPEIEQPPVVQPAVVKLELEPLDEKLPPQEQPSTNPDTRSQQWQQLIPDQQQQKHQLLQHHPSSRDINQHHILQHQQGEHPNHGQSHQQHPPQQQSASIEWTAPPSHLVQEPRAALQNQQQPVSSWDGTSVIPSQPVTPPPHQSQWIRSNVASQQQPQLNDAKGHPTDKGNQQQNAGWGSATNIRAAGSEFMYENEVPSSQPTGRSEQHQQQLQNPTPITWGHQPAQAHRLAPQQQYPSPHQPMEPTMEQLSSSQQAPSPSVVHVRHLLVKYCGSRNPTSLKDPTGEKIRQRSIEEAMETLKRLRVEAIGGSEANFADLATQWSDCNSSKRGGDLGAFGRGKMQPPFEAVAFDLPVGMVSDIVLTNSGAHIIYRVS